MKTRRRAVAWSAILVVLAATLSGVLASARIVVSSYCRGELQSEADRMALQVGEALARHDDVNPVNLSGASKPITLGQWDATRRQFRRARAGLNAVEVVVEGPETRASGDWLSWLFATDRVMGRTHAVATVRPRDIVFVIDLSGAMTAETRAALEHLFHRAVEDSAYSEDRELRRLYADLGFDAYPGVLEPFGTPWQAGEGHGAYETLISEDGPLADPATSQWYRIDPGDPVSTRRRKAYRAVIDRQVTRLMPRARPSPDVAENFEYWAEYLDEVLLSDDRYARIGYASYIRFMLDHGRSIRAGGQYVALSQYSDDCQWQSDLVEGVHFRFPPRTQPMHQVRRGLVAALDEVATRNRAVEPSSQRDQVAIVTFDSLSPGGAWVEQPLTSDYGAAANRSACLQAVGERVRTATGLAGLQVAQALLCRSADVMPSSRDASQLVVLVTAGPIAEEQVLHAQIAAMTQLGQSVSVISVGPAQEGVSAGSPVAIGPRLFLAEERGLPGGSELGGGQLAESIFREAVAPASVVLVQ